MKKEIFICWSIIMIIAFLGSVIVLQNLIVIKKNQEQIKNETKIASTFNRLNIQIEEIKIDLYRYYNNQTTSLNPTLNKINNLYITLQEIKQSANEKNNIKWQNLLVSIQEIIKKISSSAVSLETDKKMLINLLEDSDKIDKALNDLIYNSPIFYQNKESIQQINLSSTKAINTIIFVFILGFLVTAIITAYLFKTLHKKISFLLNGVKEVSSGNLNYIIPVIYKDEFGLLTNSFNNMSQTLKRKEDELSINNEKLLKINTRLKDLTEKLEEKVQTRTEELESIMQTMGEGLFTVNNEQKIIYFNHAAEEISGYKKEEITNKTCVEIFRCPNCTLNCAFLNSSEAKEKIKCQIVKETYILNKDGQKIPVIKDAILLKDKNNNILGTVETIRDITKIKEMEQMKSDFVSMMTHDLKSPLTSILGFASLCIDNKNLAIDETCRSYLERIKFNGYRMLNLIENFLTISKLETLKTELNLKQIDIKKVLNDIVKDIQTQAVGKQISIQSFYEENIPLIFADELQIERVFHNIFSNAIKYSPNGPGRDIYLNVIKQKKYLEISIEDHGIGIPEKEIKNIFEKYKRSSETQKIKGYGLGLFIVKNIVEAHGGSVMIKSEEGKGTKVMVILPLK